LTPEQQAEEQAKRAELRRKHEEQLERDRDSERQRRLKYLDAMRTTACQLKNHNAKLATNTAYVLHDLGCQWLTTHETLLDRAERMAYDPANYFAWAEEDMKLAAMREILDRILRRIQEDKKTLIGILLEADAWITENLLENRNRPSSTSAAHNAMECARNEVQSSFLRHHLKGWITAVQKEVAPQPACE
jgi:hypothetical protein